MDRGIVILLGDERTAEEESGTVLGSELDAQDPALAKLEKAWPRAMKPLHGIVG
ncbi:MAG: hypothetical protein RLN70_03000 [Rhodospirillaceae bacterium]